jgi:hypothetical protein
VERAAPCCGWSVLDEAAGRAIVDGADFRWFEQDAVPTLGAVRFADIHFDDLHRADNAIFSAKTAMRCELPD